MLELARHTARSKQYYMYYHAFMAFGSPTEDVQNEKPLCTCYNYRMRQKK